MLVLELSSIDEFGDRHPVLTSLDDQVRSLISLQVDILGL